MKSKNRFRRVIGAGILLAVIVSGLIWIFTMPQGLSGTFAYKVGPADSFGASWKYCYTFREDGTGLWEQFEGGGGFLDLPIPPYNKKSERPFTYKRNDMSVSVRVEGLGEEQYIMSDGDLRGVAPNHPPVFRQRSFTKRW